jgi:hypothetical protein
VGGASIISSRRGNFFFVVFAVIVLIASFLHDQPDLDLWAGPLPRVPSRTGTSDCCRPDGMLRLIPRWEVVWFNHTYFFNIIVITVILRVPRDRRDPSSKRGLRATSVSTTSTPLIGRRVSRSTRYSGRRQLGPDGPHFRSPSRAASTYSRCSSSSAQVIVLHHTKHASACRRRIGRSRCTALSRDEDRLRLGGEYIEVHEQTGLRARWRQ